MRKSLLCVLAVLMLCGLGVAQSNLRYDTSAVIYNTKECWEASFNSGAEACIQRASTNLITLQTAAGSPVGPADGYAFISPANCAELATTTAISTGPAMVRAAAGNAVLSATTNTTGGTIAVTCQIPFATRTTAGYGWKILDVSLAYGVQTTALTSIAAATVNTIAYPAAGAAAAGTVTSTAGGTLTVTPGTLQLTTTTSGQCFNEKLTFGTPLLLNADTTGFSVDQVFTTAGTTATTLQICGVWVHYTNYLL
jgi:hypothetical protein